MKRSNLEFLIAWPEALRRRDTEALESLLDPNVVWHGHLEEWTCHRTNAVVDTFTAERDADRKVADYANRADALSTAGLA